MGKLSKEDKIKYDSLMATIRRIFGDKGNYGLIEQQIANFVHLYNYTYSGIEYTLIYWHDIKGNQLEEQYGIKIVSSIYNEAREYKKMLWESQKANENKNFDKLKMIKNIRIDMPVPVKYKTAKDIEIDKFLERDM